MKVYLINNETNEIISEYNNVTNWSYNFVEFDNNGKCKIYCNEDEYFTDINPEEVADEYSKKKNHY